MQPIIGMYDYGAINMLEHNYEEKIPQSVIFQNRLYSCTNVETRFIFYHYICQIDIISADKHIDLVQFKIILIH